MTSVLQSRIHELQNDQSVRISVHLQAVALSVLAVAAAAPQGYGAPPQGYGAPVSGSAAGQQPVYGAQGAAGAQSRDAQARTLSEENINNGDGTYRFRWEHQLRNRVSHLSELGAFSNTEVWPRMNCLYSA